MGEVYRARDPRLRREVALKVLPAELSADPDRLRRFEQEAWASSSLNHPNILVVHDIGEQDGRPYVVFELLEGTTLREQLAVGVLPARKALEYAAQIARGLAAAHEKGIVHRDLKPENLFVTRDGRIKILDFGLAKLTTPVSATEETSAPTTPRGTEPGVVLGTVGYMSPEQVRGAPADHRSDIFALGAVLYEMLTGRRAFRGDSAVETLNAILKEEPPEPETSTSVSPALHRLLRRCLEKSSEQRFQSASDLSFALEALTTGWETQVPVPAAARRTRWPWALATVAILGVLLLLAVSRRAVRREVTPETAASPTPAAARPTAHLAILPLRILTPAKEIDYLGVGIPDAITTRLANVRTLRIRPTASVLRYEKAVVDPQKAGEELAADHVLVGTVQKTGEAYRINFQLVRTNDGVPLWGQSFDLAEKELLDLQDSVARQVTAALRVQMTAAEQERVYQRYTRNPRAHQLYLEGRSLLANYDEQKMRDAIVRFEEALRLDPDNALARAGLATALAFFATRYAYEQEARDWGRRAEQEAMLAIRQAPELAETHLAQANAAATLYRDFDWARLISGAEKALTLNPNLDLAHTALARALYHLGLFDRCRSELRKAAGITGEDTVEAARAALTMEFYDSRFAEARRLAEDLLLRTDLSSVRMFHGWASFYLGEPDRAREVLSGIRRSSRKPDVRSQTVLASVLAAGGDHAGAEQILDAVNRGDFMDHHVAYSLGAAYAQLGRDAEALRWLRESARTGFPCYPWFARDPMLAPLRGKPDFEALLGEMRRSFEDSKARYGGKATEPR